MNYKLVNFCEFDEKTSMAYCKIHNVGMEKNLGDITLVNEHEIDGFNFICGGSPCQDFSFYGTGKGSMWECKDCEYQYNPITQNYKERGSCPICGSKNINKTRSSLLVEWLRIVEANKPSFGLFENVKDITKGKHKETFDLFVKELESYGYNVYWDILNSTDFGIPQKRLRLYLLIIKRECDNGKFNFGLLKRSSHNGVKEILDDETNVEDWYYRICPSMVKAIENGKCKIIGLDRNSETVTTKQDRWNNSGFLDNGNGLRYFTERECFKLMGFEDRDYDCIDEFNRHFKYKLAGNSIVVDVLYELFYGLRQVMPYLFDDLKVCSFFSGIGAFEKALEKLK